MIKFFNRCLFCKSARPTALNLCMNCAQKLPFIEGPACERCLNPISEAATLCGVCLSQKTYFDQVIAPFYLEGIVHQGILNFKFNHDLMSGRLLSEYLRRAIVKKEVQYPNLIIPVPLYWQRQVKRGFNQAHEIARYLSAALGVRLGGQNLIRIKKTPIQSQSSKLRRRLNLKDAFKARRSGLPEHIALVDDVFTTGNTASQCAKILKKNGAQCVDVWVLARTVSCKKEDG